MPGLTCLKDHAVGPQDERRTLDHLGPVEDRDLEFRVFSAASPRRRNTGWTNSFPGTGSPCGNTIAPPEPIIITRSVSSLPDPGV